MGTRTSLALLFAALTIAGRLPFLVTGKIPFDSDEAVEGLMARHVLEGDLPVFFWGQAFKGVPEVYLSAGAFALFGANVLTLKAVTLALFAAYVALNFILLDRTASRWLAAASSVLLAAAPPALVFWSLDASAEYVWIMLLGTGLVILESKKLEVRSKKLWLGAIGLIVGAGLWVHQLFLIYLVPLAVVAWRENEWWKRRPAGGPSAPTWGLIAIAGLYLALGIVAFVTGGFDLELGSLSIGARTPQKLLRIGAAVGALAAAVHFVQRAPRGTIGHLGRSYWPAAAGFAIGYAPVVLYSVFVEPARSPARSATLGQLAAAAPDIFGNIVPIVFGFKIATTERLALPALAAIPGAAALAAYVWSSRGRLGREFFPLFVVFVPALFLASGAYLDTQSYRYLIPWYAGLAVAWAGGARALGRGSPNAATLLVAAIAGVHLWQQALWYQKLQPDTASPALLRCMQAEGLRGGYADYWTAYKLTFLSEERIIVAPNNGVDRHPPYTDYVRSLPADARLDEVVNAGSAACR